jgi:cellulose synthase/poly-beta-1,6-N-acetylglucosamine synthase-like glycosyltransferase
MEAMLMPSLNRQFQRHHSARAYTRTLYLLALAALVWHNWRLWRRDKAMLATWRQPDPLPTLDSWPALPMVSVLVAAWNEEAHIARHVEGFLALRYPCKELVLCAGGDDATYALAQRYAGPNFTLIEQAPGEGKQRALRRAFQSARGEILFLTDADCVLDDESFERTLQPILQGEEEACTGESYPHPELLENPFVVAQTASQFYTGLHRPRYAPGLLGRNTAVTRRLLEQSEGLNAEAPTGTDYVLAKMLARTGARIRQIAESRVATEYPLSVRAYIRQQRRWLRNVALYGWKFGAIDEVRASIQTSATGILMLILPAWAWIVHRNLLLVWLGLLFHAFSSRLRYLYVLNRLGGAPVDVKQIFLQMAMLFLDFAAWSRPVFDYFSPRGQRVW